MIKLIKEDGTVHTLKGVRVVAEEIVLPPQRSERIHATYGLRMGKYEGPEEFTLRLNATIRRFP